MGHHDTGAQELFIRWQTSIVNQELAVPSSTFLCWYHRALRPSETMLSGLGIPVVDVRSETSGC